MNNHWDVIVVGAGPAGINAAMVLGRSRRKVMIIDEGKHRNERSQGIHNYLTRDGILPAEFLSISFGELKRYNVHYVKGRAMRAAMLEENGFEIEDSNGKTYTCRKLLLATGVTDIIPDIPGMHDLWGRGVYHCPFCDGWDLHGQTVGLYSKKYNGYGMAMSLRQLTDKVILFTDTATYLKPVQRKHLISRDIQIVTTKISELTCDKGKLTCVKLANGESIGCDSVFTHNGIRYNNDLVMQLGGRCSTQGAAIINRRQECSIPGVYVAGDVAFDMQFVAVAASEGVKAAVTIHSTLLKEDNAAALQQLAAPQISQG